MIDYKDGELKEFDAKETFKPDLLGQAVRPAEMEIYSTSDSLKRLCKDTAEEFGYCGTVKFAE